MQNFTEYTHIEYFNYLEVVVRVNLNCETQRNKY